MSRFTNIVLGFAALLASSAIVASPERANVRYDIDQLYQEIRRIVRRDYPAATLHKLDGKIHFEHDTRIFVVHEPLKTGQWQDPWEERGPKINGIYGDIEIREGRWQGAAVVPQSFDKRYFTMLLMAPYSDRLDAHLVVHIKYPRNVPNGFLKDLTELLNHFEEHSTRQNSK